MENERACSYLQCSVQPVSIFHLEFSLSEKVECDFDKCESYWKGRRFSTET